MKLSNYAPKFRGMTQEQKDLIESYFWGEKSKEIKDPQGIVLNSNWQISRLTGVTEFRVSKYIDYLPRMKRNKLNDET